MSDFEILRIMAGKSLSQLMMMKKDLHLRLPAKATLKDYARARSVLKKTIKLKEHAQDSKTLLS